MSAPDLRRLPIGNHRLPCHVCDRGAKDTALSVKVDERGATYICHRCGLTGAKNFERISASRPSVPSAPKASPLEWSDTAARIWRQTQPLRGSLGEIYLRARRCALPPADSDLQFLPATDRYPPSLCARISDAKSNAPLSLHFTRLKADGTGKAGTDCDKLLLKGHRKAGGCIRLWRDECVTYGLAISEGVETGLAAAHAFQPVWAAIDAGNMASFPVLAGIDVITLIVDHDPAGLKAAAEVAGRWRAARREVRMLMAADRGADIADEIAS